MILMTGLLVKYGLIKHIKIVHVTKEKKTFKCDNCGAKFSFRYKLPKCKY